ncbi:unnamed protein product [Gongylonema pulchrum]|uniref:Autophagy_act_C domain-containing protein n=1 Tax=Gongylonema pulchrum TaxID=637853 RepID=A0A183EBH1_9BILA|nr:unnamed protein product [Gongylonema pulchrum]
MAAFMYPMHFPAVPLRWDEPAWAIYRTDTMEEALLLSVEARMHAQYERNHSPCISYVYGNVYGGSMLQDIDDVEDEEELADEDDEQNQ